MTPLHSLGDLVRDLFLAVPLPAVRVLFVGTLLALLLWVCRLPSAATSPAGGARHWHQNLKYPAALALIIQIVIYAWL